MYKGLVESLRSGLKVEYPDQKSPKGKVFQPALMVAFMNIEVLSFELLIGNVISLMST